MTIAKRSMLPVLMVLVFLLTPSVASANEYSVIRLPQNNYNTFRYQITIPNVNAQCTSNSSGNATTVGFITLTAWLNYDDKAGDGGKPWVEAGFSDGAGWNGVDGITNPPKCYRGLYWVKAKRNASGNLIAYTEWRGSNPAVGTDNNAELIATHSGYAYVTIDGKNQLSFTGYRKNTVPIDHGYETILNSGMTWAPGYIKSMQVFQWNSDTDYKWISMTQLTSSFYGYNSPTTAWEVPSFSTTNNVSTFVRK